MSWQFSVREVLKKFAKNIQLETLGLLDNVFIQISKQHVFQLAKFLKCRLM